MKRGLDDLTVVRSESHQRSYIPVFRHIAEPFDAGGLHGDVRVQALGDGVRDDGLTFFLQQFNQPPLLLHQPVNLRSLRVKKCHDQNLLIG